MEARRKEGEKMGRVETKVEQEEEIEREGAGRGGGTKACATRNGAANAVGEREWRRVAKCECLG